MKQVWAEKYLNHITDKCWFCRKKGCDEFDDESDTFLHKKCLVETLEKDPNHPEAKLMKYLFED